MITITHSEKTGDLTATFAGDAGYPNVLEQQMPDALARNIVQSIAREITFEATRTEAKLRLLLKTA